MNKKDKDSKESKNTLSAFLQLVYEWWAIDFCTVLIFFFNQDKYIREYGVTEALEDNVCNWTENPTLQRGVWIFGTQTSSGKRTARQAGSKRGGGRYSGLYYKYEFSSNKVIEQELHLSVHE